MNTPIVSKAAPGGHPLASTLLTRFPGVALFAACALLAWFSLPTLASLNLLWLGDYNYSHGYLVLAVSVFLAVRELRREPLGALEPSWAGFACLALLALVTTAAHASSTVVIAQLALPPLWVAAVWAFAGVAVARRFIWPIGFLYFAIPFWDLATEPLRLLTIQVVSTGVRLFDVPAFIQGNLIHLPSGTVQIAEGCAGLRYAIVAATLGAFLGLLNHGRRATAILTACALALAILGNWARVFSLVLVGYYSEMQHYLIVEDHSVFGWVVFLVFLAPLLYVDRKLSSQSAVEIRSTGTASRMSAKGTHAAVAYSACAALAIGIWLNHRVDQDPSDAFAAVVLTAPEVPGWRRAAEWEDARRPDFVGTTSQLARWYDDGVARVAVYLAHYASQGQSREVVFAQNRPEGRGATVVARRRVSVPMSGVSLAFEELEVTDTRQERRLVWVGLRVGGKETNGVVLAKLLQISGAIRGRRDAQALVFSAVCAADCGGARESLSRYAPVATQRLYAQADGPWDEARESKATL